MTEKVFYTIVTQYDISAKQAAKFCCNQKGPFIAECLLDEHAANEALVREHAKYVGCSLTEGDRGWVRIAKVIVDIPDPESFCCEQGQALGLNGIACPQCAETNAAYQACLGPGCGT
jgi:hypothetical protein